jgi:hypothetical protein
MRYDNALMRGSPFQYLQVMLLKQFCLLHKQTVEFREAPL